MSFFDSLTAWLQELGKVFFGIEPAMAVVAETIFPDKALEIEAGTKVLASVGVAMAAAKNASPADGTGIAKKALAMGDVAKTALNAAASLSTGGQADFLNRILPVASSLIDKTAAQVTANVVVPADNQAATQQG